MPFSALDVQSEICQVSKAWAQAGLGIVANTALRSNVILSAGQPHNKSARIEIHLLYSFTYQSRTIRKCWE